MIQKKIGMITIGQSPRVDIVPEMREVLGTEVKIIESRGIGWFNVRRGEEILS